MNSETTRRLSLLRQWMKDNGIDAFITPSTDPHSGEYIPSHWKSREWISGFTGSAGTAVVTAESAALWTDSRYFIQAAAQLAGTGFALMKERIEGTPTIEDWLTQQLDSKGVVAVDGWVNTAMGVEWLRHTLSASDITLRTDADPYAAIWTDRPAMPDGKVFIQPLKYAGESAADKIGRLRQRLNGKALLVSMLEEVAWTLNLRSNDVTYTPFLVSYLVVTPEDATLYIDSQKLTPEVCAYLTAEGVSHRPYDSLQKDLENCPYRVCFDPAKTNCAAATAIAHPVHSESPVAKMLIYKNETEQEGFRRAMERDGVAMVKWMKWTMEHVADGGETELSLAARLEAFRAEQQGFSGLSFESIMAYGPHAALPHYDPTPESDIPVEPRGLLLIDSGGQYPDGTTDITRTIPLGPLTYEERRDYTLCLRGFINLGRAVFPKGTCGTQLDALARTPMWEYGINYLHGTGHGVGSFLSVHEGVSTYQFRMNSMPYPLSPGMTITDEPGIYIEGSHGIRHENTMLVREANIEGCGTEGRVYGPYYCFEHLTLCPIITSPIIKEMLTATEIQWLNGYHATVRERLEPLLDEEHRLWLNAQTAAIS